ncbi:tail fiber domain-containing protein [Metaclostridioides mangenotii]|uniref:tail fiber domain-containing protein n=1 Tax=Metaclostridioides mangenotii TaxID=1540 RepID=UPI0026ED9085|nr:tail fiber domain-containing protein [Clostridioides mangenotii]
MPKYMATINNMGNFKYTNATAGTVYDERTKSFINNALQTRFVELRPNDSEEVSMKFKDSDNNLKCYIFYHPAPNINTMGFYDAVGPRAIFRTVLGSTELTFAKHLIPELTLNLGSAARRWGTLYCTSGVNQSSDRNSKEDIQYINDKSRNNDLTNTDFKDFIKDVDLATYKLRDTDDKTTQLGFIAQDVQNSKVGEFLIKKDEEGTLSYSLSSYVNVLAGALQVALKEIEELKNR